MCPGVVERKIKQQVRVYSRLVLGWLISICIGRSQVSQVKWHFEQSPEGNERASYVDIWEMSIPREGTEFWAILKYKVAKRALLSSCPPFPPSFFLKLCGNKDYF